MPSKEDELRLENEELTKRLKDHKKTEAEFRKLMENMKEKNQGHVKDLKNQLEEAKKGAQHAESEREKAEHELNNIKLDLERTRGDDRVLRDDDAHHIEMLREVKHQISLVEHERDALRRELEDVRFERDQIAARDRLVTDEEQREHRHVQELRAELKEIRVERDQLKSQLEEEQYQHRTLQGELETAKKDRGQALKRSQTKDFEELREARNQAISADRERDELRRSLDDERSRVSSLQDQLQETSSALAEERSELDIVRRAFEEARRRPAELHSRASEERAQHEMHLTRLRESLQAAQSSRIQLQEQLDKVNADAVHNHTDTREAVQDLQTRLLASEAECYDLRRCNEEALENNRLLQGQLRRIRETGEASMGSYGATAAVQGTAVASGAKLVAPLPLGRQPSFVPMVGFVTSPRNRPGGSIALPTGMALVTTGQAMPQNQRPVSAGGSRRTPRAASMGLLHTAVTPTSTVQQRPGSPSRVNLTATAKRMSTPTAAVGIDMNGDGIAEYIVSGEDRDHDGIPDILQQPGLLEDFRQRQLPHQQQVGSPLLTARLPFGTALTVAPPGPGTPTASASKAAGAGDSTPVSRSASFKNQPRYFSSPQQPRAPTLSGSVVAAPGAVALPLGAAVATVVSPGHAQAPQQQTTSSVSRLGATARPGHISPRASKAPEPHENAGCRRARSATGLARRPLIT